MVVLAVVVIVRVANCVAAPDEAGTEDVAEEVEVVGLKAE